MKVAFRFGLAHTHTHVRFLLVFAGFLFLTLPDSISFKSSFCICSPGSFQVTWSFPTLWSSWHGCPNCFATRSPKHMTLAFQQCHLQVCLWREETEAMPHSRLWLCHQRSTHCVPATTTPGFFLDLTFSANSFLLCETCFFNLWCVLGRPLWPALCTIRKGLVEAVASNLMLCSVRTCGWTAWMYGSLHVPHLYGRVGAAEDGPEEGHGGHGAERASSTTATPVFTASWDEDASNGKSGTASSSDT